MIIKKYWWPVLYERVPELLHAILKKLYIKKIMLGLIIYFLVKNKNLFVNLKFDVCI